MNRWQTLLWLLLKGLLISLLGGCTLFKPPGVKVLVPEPRNAYIAIAKLSPEQDKLFYVLQGVRGNTFTKRFIFDIATGEGRELEVDCSPAAWIDNQTLLCGYRPVLLNVKDFSTFPLQSVDARKEPFLHLFEGGQKVYKISHWDAQTAYMLVGNPPEPSYLIQKLPRNFQPPPHVTVALAGTVWPETDEKVFSPDGSLYFINKWEQKHHWLRIYSAEGDLLREVDFEGGATVYGWTFDNQGVLYQTHRGMLDPRSHPIHILTVPE